MKSTISPKYPQSGNIHFRRIVEFVREGTFEWCWGAGCTVRAHGFSLSLST
jgi:hypothetical protein